MLKTAMRASLLSLSYVTSLLGSNPAVAPRATANAAILMKAPSCYLSGLLTILSPSATQASLLLPDPGGH